MKKIFVIICSAVFMCGVFQNMANAKECRVTTCTESNRKTTGNSILSTNGLLGAEAASSGGQCYRCNWGDNDYECKEGTVIAIKHQDYATNGRINGFYRCEDEGVRNDEWVKYEPTHTCGPDLGSLPSTAKNTESYFHINGVKTGSVRSETGDSLVLANGSDGCVMYVCKKGYTPNTDKTDCISAESVDCAASGGTWNGSACQCDSNKGLKQDSSKTACVCKNSGYEYVDRNQKCEETEASKQRRDQKKNQSMQQQCESSGGVWIQKTRQCSCSAQKNLKLNGNTCECKDNNYKKSSDRKSCVLTDDAARKRECESAAATNSDVYWDESAKECKCRDIKKEFVSGKCEIKEAITKCNSVTGAKWSDYNEECVCVDDNMKIDSTGTKCVEKEYVKQEREQKVIADKIISAGGELDSIVAGFGKANVWKNAQGEFNTARLASDSIAAVVLGTAGGLITSSVMKKHQVEDGFEDLKCVIGGQPVAGWGDEFRVGIQ